MKVKPKTKARAIVAWFVLSVCAVLFTAEHIGIPLVVSLVSLIFSSRMTIINADMIDQHIKMID